MADGLRRALTSPKVVFAALGALLVLTVLLTPDADGRPGDPRLTTHSAAPQGARGLFEIARRLGWRAERREAPFNDPLDSTAVYATLDPPSDLTANEAHRLLDAVRHGAGLLFVVRKGGALTDSLGLGVSTDLQVSTVGGALAVDSAALRQAPCSETPWPEGRGAINWQDGEVHSYWLTPVAKRPRDTVTFASVWRLRDPSDPRPPASDSGRRAAVNVRSPAATGFPYGRGRVVAVADPDLLRNDVLRVCRWGLGVTAVRMLEWLGGGVSQSGAHGTRRLVFDEYHQGYGTHANPARTVARFLTDTGLGRTILQGIAAGALLLAALGARPLLPRARERVERRSPLEHVSALAEAYGQVGATRLATRRLIHGLRRRHAHGAWRRASDEEFLRAIAARRPAAAPAVSRLLDAAARPLTPAEFAQVGEAVDDIDQRMRE